MPIDDELRAYFDAKFAEVRGEVVETILKEVRREVVETILKAVNDGDERILNRLGSLEHDYQNVRGFMLNDAAVSGRRWLDLEERVTRLERKLP